MTLPDGLLLSFYGDDFTGSTDVMEALALAGLRTVLFLEPPRPEMLQRFPGLRAVGIAGFSRALPTTAMAAELRPVFQSLFALHTPLVHYKICSTFDSSPEIGSIGQAIEIGKEIFGPQMTPLLVGAPVLGRYQVFGNLFARSGGDSDVFRLDRHPTMRQHPVTPMRESDLVRHLAQQTPRRIGLFDIRKLSGTQEEIEERYAALHDSGVEIALLDVLDNSQLPTLGRLIWQDADSQQPHFVAGSSGVEYALTACWRAEGDLPPASPPPTFGPARQLLVVSGSCSPVTARQIACAVGEGFEEFPLPSLHSKFESEMEPALLNTMRDALHRGRSVILHSSRGPDDPRLAETERAFDTPNAKQQIGRWVGQALGRYLRALLRDTDVRRVVVTGGDTSGVVAREIGIEALEMFAPVAPGSPLCHAISSDAFINGLEILFKGGQVGKDNLFCTILHGTQ